MQREACLWLLSHVFLCFPLWDVILGRGILGLLGLKRAQKLCPSWRMPGTSDDQRRFGIFCHLRTRSTVWGVWGGVRVTCRIVRWLYTILQWPAKSEGEMKKFWQLWFWGCWRIKPQNLWTLSPGITRLTWLTQPTRQRKNSQQEAQQAAPKCPEPSAPDLWGSSSLDLKTH